MKRVAVLALLLLTACELDVQLGNVVPRDAGSDASSDAAFPDAATPDASRTPDASFIDADQ
jgi:hypothetical protein